MRASTVQASGGASILHGCALLAVVRPDKRPSIERLPKWAACEWTLVQSGTVSNTLRINNMHAAAGGKEPSVSRVVPGTKTNSKLCQLHLLTGQTGGVSPDRSYDPLLLSLLQIIV